MGSEPEKKESTFLKDIIFIVLVTAFIVLPIRIFIAQPFVVSGESMSPTFENGDYLIVDQLSYRIENPERYDVIIFRYPNDTKKFFIKRIIGLPGEKINATNGKIAVETKDNKEKLELNESYVKNKSVNGTFSTQLNDGEYFVMGDNRTASLDSRIWGALDRNLIAGKALFRLLPFTKIGFMPGKHKDESKIIE